jgi:hypothetical protein
MNFEQEKSSYIEFVKENFTNAFSVREGNPKKYINDIFRINCFFGILKDYHSSTTENNTDLNMLAERCNGLLWHLLYAIAISDQIFVMTCFRQLSETTLRIVYSEWDQSSSDVLKTSYRQIWENSIKQNRLYKENTLYKENLDNLSSIFAEASNVVHLKKISNPVSGFFLNNILQDGIGFDIKKTESLTKKFTKSVIILLPEICHLDTNQMTISQKQDYMDIFSNL